MPSKPVHVEIGESGLPVRIFNNKDWRLLPEDRTQVMTKQQAVGSIREQVFERNYNAETDAHECEKCGRSINWTSFEMNEKRPKGKGGGFTGGEVSLENCEALCRNCHQGNKDSAHGNRMWQTAKLGAR